MKAKTASLVIAGIGALASAAGTKLFKAGRRNRLGAGILGFGLANLALGLLDLARPAVRD